MPAPPPAPAAAAAPVQHFSATNGKWTNRVPIRDRHVFPIALKTHQLVNVLYVDALNRKDV